MSFWVAVSERVNRQAGRRSMTFHPVVLVAMQERELRWLGRLLIPGRTRFPIGTARGGLPLPPRRADFRHSAATLSQGLLEVTRQGFEAMNVSPKGRAEAE